MQGTELAGEDKTEYKTIYDNIYIHIFNSKKVTTVWKKTHTHNIIFYTHYFSYSTDNHKQLL